MMDYTLAIGNEEPYGFSAPGDGAAIAHAADYLATRGVADSLVALSGPDGILTTRAETLAAFRLRVAASHSVENTDDVRPADPTPPDCNRA